MNWVRIIEYTLNDGIFLIMLLVIHFYVAEMIWLRNKLGKNYSTAPDFLPEVKKKSRLYMSIAAAVFIIFIFVHSRVGNITYDFILRGSIFIAYLGFSVKTWRRISYGNVLYYGEKGFAVYKFAFLGSTFFNTRKWSEVKSAESFPDNNGRNFIIEFNNGKKPIIVKSPEGGQDAIEQALRERIGLEEKK